MALPVRYRTDAWNCVRRREVAYKPAYAGCCVRREL